jgi:hypothetical protein
MLSLIQIRHQLCGAPQYSYQAEESLKITKTNVTVDFNVDEISPKLPGGSGSELEMVLVLELPLK